MKLAKEQKIKVEENLGLVYKVLADKLKGVKANRQKDTEVFDDYGRDIPDTDTGERRAEINFDVVRALVSAKAEAPPHVVKGIDTMLLMAKGYTCREIGEKMGASDNLVSAYVSKARKYLKSRSGSAQMTESYAASRSRVSEQSVRYPAFSILEGNYVKTQKKICHTCPYISGDICTVSICTFYWLCADRVYGTYAQKRQRNCW